MEGAPGVIPPGTFFHEPPALRCVTCRRLFAGTVADVVANYRSHQCAPYSALFDPPPAHSMIGNRR